jgi:hypothetical protein
MLANLCHTSWMCIAFEYDNKTVWYVGRTAIFLVSLSDLDKTELRTYFVRVIKRMSQFVVLRCCYNYCQFGTLTESWQTSYGGNISGVAR